MGDKKIRKLLVLISVLVATIADDSSPNVTSVVTGGSLQNDPKLVNVKKKANTSAYRKSGSTADLFGVYPPIRNVNYESQNLWQAPKNPNEYLQNNYQDYLDQSQQYNSCVQSNHVGSTYTTLPSKILIHSLSILLELLNHVPDFEKGNQVLVMLKTYLLTVPNSREKYKLLTKLKSVEDHLYKYGNTMHDEYFSFNAKNGKLTIVVNESLKGISQAQCSNVFSDIILNSINIYREVAKRPRCAGVNWRNLFLYEGQQLGNTNTFEIKDRFQYPLNPSQPQVLEYPVLYPFKQPKNGDSTFFDRLKPYLNLLPNSNPRPMNDVDSHLYDPSQTLNPSNNGNIYPSNPQENYPYPVPPVQNNPFGPLYPEQDFLITPVNIPPQYSPLPPSQNNPSSPSGTFPSQYYPPPSTPNQSPQSNDNLFLNPNQFYKFIKLLERLEPGASSRVLSPGIVNLLLKYFNIPSQNFPVNTPGKPLDKNRLDRIKSLLQWLTVSNWNKLPTSPNKGGFIEITYILKRPKPVIYHPIYYVKYKMPYKSYVQHLNDIILTKPELINQPKKLYQELLSRSNVEPISSQLYGHSKDDILKLIYENGTLVSANLVTEPSTDYLNKQLKDIKDLNSNAGPESVGWDILDWLNKTNLVINKYPGYYSTTKGDLSPPVELVNQNKPEYEIVDKGAVNDFTKYLLVNSPDGLNVKKSERLSVINEPTVYNLPGNTYVNIQSDNDEPEHKALYQPVEIFPLKFQTLNDQGKVTNQNDNSQENIKVNNLSKYYSVDTQHVNRDDYNTIDSQYINFLSQYIDQNNSYANNKPELKNENELEINLRPYTVVNNPVNNNLQEGNINNPTDQNNGHQNGQVLSNVQGYESNLPIYKIQSLVNSVPVFTTSSQLPVKNQAYTHPNRQVLNAVPLGQTGLNRTHVYAGYNNPYKPVQNNQQNYATSYKLVNYPPGKVYVPPRLSNVNKQVYNNRYDSFKVYAKPAYNISNPGGYVYQSPYQHILQSYRVPPKESLPMRDLPLSVNEPNTSVFESVKEKQAESNNFDLNETNATATTNGETAEVNNQTVLYFTASKKSNQL